LYFESHLKYTKYKKHPGGANMKQTWLFVIATVVLFLVATGCHNNPVGPGCALCAQETQTAEAGKATATATPTNGAVVNATATATQTATETSTTVVNATATATATSTNVVSQPTATATSTPVSNIWYFTLTGANPGSLCVNYQSTADGTLTSCSGGSNTTLQSSGSEYVAPTSPVSVTTGNSFNFWIDNTSGEQLTLNLYRNGSLYGTMIWNNGDNFGHVY
jgi:hypothetical protein